MAIHRAATTGTGGSTCDIGLSRGGAETKESKTKVWVRPAHRRVVRSTKLSRAITLILYLGYTIRPERQAYVEFRDGTGEWIRHNSHASTAEPPESTQNPVNQSTDPRGDGDGIVSALDQVPPILSSHETIGQQMISPMELAPPQAASPTCSELVRVSDGSSLLDDFLQDQDFGLWGYPHDNNAEIGGHLGSSPPFNGYSIDSMLDGPLFQPGLFSLGGGFQYASLGKGQLETIEASAHKSFSISQDLQKRPDGLATALVQRSRQMLEDHTMKFEETNLPDVEDVTDSLESLILEDIDRKIGSPESQIIERNASFGPGFKKLLYSVINGFAGLRNLPRSSILRLIHDDHQTQSHLFKLLNTSPSSIAKPLADNLFRAAVESCDPQAVAAIVNITSNNPEIAIDPNDIRCEFGGRDYTAVELAAKFRSIEIVQALLTAKADPNKTYSEDERNERGALELAVRRWGTFRRVDLSLVRLLLRCGAKVRISLAEAVVRWGHTDKELLHELLNGIPDAQHSAVFKSREMLKDVVEYLENEAATGIVQRFFEACKSTNCGECASTYATHLEDMLVSAARRGNLVLVESLLPHTEGTTLALAGAVRSRNLQLINLLGNSATVDGPGGYLDGPDSKYGPKLSPVTTPLAEAIRAQDYSQVQEFEQRGALACLAQSDHFRAAVFASAETGDVAYLQKVLDLVPAYRHNHLTPALNIAIKNDQTEAALILLDAGANVNYKHKVPANGLPLLEALERRNTRVVDAILESDWDSSVCDPFKPYMEPAVIWGDIKVIEDLALMGVDLDAGRHTTALTAAVMNQNEPLVHHLLQLGATASAQAYLLRLSPLEAAVKNGDYDMMALLMSRGASAADSGAFAYARKHDLKAYNMLLSACKDLSLMERKGCGGKLLIDAIVENDLLAVDVLLEVHVDINKVCCTEGKARVSPLGFAIKYKKGSDHELVRKLLRAGGDPNSIAAESHVGTYDNYIRRLETPLLLAIQTRNEETAEILIKAGAHVNRPARRGIKRTPLQEACQINSFKMVKFMLLQGANVNDPAAERGGYTALQLAAINGSIKIARLLLDNNADPHGAPSKVGGRTAFEGAAENGCRDMLGLLYSASLPKPPDQKEMQRARQLAQARGERSCVDYIDSLLDAPSSGLTPLTGFELP